MIRYDRSATTAIAAAIPVAAIADKRIFLVIFCNYTEEEACDHFKIIKKNNGVILNSTLIWTIDSMQEKKKRKCYDKVTFLYCS